MKLDEAVRLIRQRWPAVRSSATDEPVFLFAAGWRSGSTMLQRMLLGNCMVWGEPYGSSGLIERLSQPLQRFAANWPLEEFFISNPHWGEQLGEKWTANLYPPIGNLLEAHVEFFRKLLAEPAKRIGFERWGLKEVRYSIEHAIYLQWLFPKARFVFLVRNPFDCWASYRRAKSQVLRFWPEELITTPEQFGEHWLKLAGGFVHRFKEVNGILVRYEELKERDDAIQLVEKHLGFSLDLIARKVMVGASPRGEIDPAEIHRLHSIVSPLAQHMAYTPR